MHYAFDKWMGQEFPNVVFERYADDVVIHSVSEYQAKHILSTVQSRMRDCGLALHPDKTKIVYCQDGKRRGKYANTSFDFLGHTFRKRSSSGKYGMFLSFAPAISEKATKKIRKDIRQWRIVSMCHLTLEEVFDMIVSKIRGWKKYYGKFYKSEFGKTMRLIERSLVRWVTRKYKTLKRRPKRARIWLEEISKRDPKLRCCWSMS